MMHMKDLSIKRKLIAIQLLTVFIVLVFFGVFAHPMVEGRVMALFMPVSTEYVGQVARKVTHYGKYSYLVFSQGRNQVKGIWPISASPLIHEWKR